MPDTETLQNELTDLSEAAARAEDLVQGARIFVEEGEATAEQKEQALSDLDAAREALQGPKSLTEIEATIHELGREVRGLHEPDQED